MIVTAASASLDAFFAGLAIGTENQSNLQRIIVGIMAVVAAMCLLSFAAARAISPTLGGLAQKIGGAILVAVGIAGAAEAVKADKPRVFMRKRGVNAILYVFLHGVGIGVDGACATAALALDGFGIGAALTVFAMHFALTELGVLLSGIRLPHAVRKCLSPSLLIALGIFKII